MGFNELLHHMKIIMNLILIFLLVVMAIVLIDINKNARNARKFSNYSTSISKNPEGIVKIENYKISTSPTKYYEIIYGKFNSSF